MGARVVEQLLKIMRQDKVEQNIVKVPVYLVPRESTRGTTE